jgi:membrane protease YdiL (CAAX protease family)
MGPNGSGALSDDQGPRLNLVSMTQYAIAVLFVMLRCVSWSYMARRRLMQTALLHAASL